MRKQAADKKEAITETLLKRFFSNNGNLAQ
jgi:hypothetical protein